MKKMSARNFLSFICIFLGVCMMLSGVRTLAAPKIDTNRGISISLKYEYNGTPISNVRFNVYKVADMQSNGSFVATQDFSRYSVSFDNLSSENLKSLSDTLSAYIMRDNITPISSSVTGDEGFAAFRFAKKQTAGLFLIIGEKKKVGNFVYTPETLLISLPTLSDDGKTYLYDVVAVPKSEVDEENKKTQIEVTKVWKNDGATESRPKSVTVQLMRDNEVYAEVTLNKENNWRYTWNNLDIKYTWTVAEKNVPNGYIVSITHSGKNYIIINTGDNSSTTSPDETTNPNDTTKPSNTTNPSSTTKPDNTTGPDKTTSPDKTTESNKTTIPDSTTTSNGTSSSVSSNVSGTTNPNSSASTTVTTTKPPKKIPQTGMLEWPIPLMLEFGTAFVIIGIVFCVRKKNEDEK